MKEITYTIKDEQGIHARPAGELVKAAISRPGGGAGKTSRCISM